MKNTKDLIKYDIETAVITALDNKYKDMQITDGKSYALVMGGLAEYRELRLKIDDKHKELKKDVLEYGRAVDAEKNRLKLLLEPGENHLKDIRQVEDDRKAKIKEEKEAKERERIEAIQEKINSIRALGTVHNTSSPAIEERIFLTEGIAISEETYQEFGDQALEAQQTAIAALEQALSDRIQFEKEEAERKAEIERLEKLRKEQEIAQAKIDEENRRIDEKAAKIAEGHRKLEAEKKAEEDRKEREEFEHQATIKAEADAKENARQKAEEAEALAAVEAEKKARQEALRPDKEKLIEYADAISGFGVLVPHVKSTKAQDILSEASNRLAKLAANIKEQVKKL